MVQSISSLLPCICYMASGYHPTKNIGLSGTTCSFIEKEPIHTLRALRRELADLIMAGISGRP